MCVAAQLYIYRFLRGNNFSGNSYKARLLKCPSSHLSLLSGHQPVVIVLNFVSNITLLFFFFLKQGRRQHTLHVTRRCVEADSTPFMGTIFWKVKLITSQEGIHPRGSWTHLISFVWFCAKERSHFSKQGNSFRRK